MQPGYHNVSDQYWKQTDDSVWMANFIKKKKQEAGRPCRFHVFLNNPHTQSLLHKAPELFNGLLSSF